MECLSSGLIEQSDVLNSSVAWQRNAYEQIASRLNPESSFPCVFSKNAFKKSLIQFVFVENNTTEAMHKLKSCLLEYTVENQNWDRQLSSAKPLLIVFSKMAVFSNLLDDYHSFGWFVLNVLHKLDPGQWPNEVNKDPSSNNWSMCFNGMQLFFNMSCPAHYNRKSRNLGEYFTMVVNPRERFDAVAGDNPKGNRIRKQIRERIETYDNLAPCKQLGYFGTDTLEWQQYSIIEENKFRPEKCPYNFEKG